MLSTPTGLKTHSRQSSEHTLFKQLTLTDALELMKEKINNIVDTVDESKRKDFRIEMDGFESIFVKYLNSKNVSINWNNIKILGHEKIIDFNSLVLPTTQKVCQELLNNLVVIKLNGGLGTSMGCTGTKSLISLRNELTFLDMTVQQIENLQKTYNCEVPLVLMNSFNTDLETDSVLRKYQKTGVDIRTFNQSRYPRIIKESLIPMASSYASGEEDEAWYPPGHGDIYRSFVNSGLCDEFLSKGKKWVFISNIDNLAATVSLGILKFLEEKNPEFIMEVTDKTRADVKGGTLIQYDGKLRLLEIAQVPKDKIDEFTSVRKFDIFNTNNLWINLDAFKRVVVDQSIHMDIIVNNKTLDSGFNIIQLEEAVGAAIQSFDGALGLRVPRTRFLPVKSTGDMLLIMSNLYELKNGEILLNPRRNFSNLPLVKLGTNFKKVKNFLDRFDGIPDLLELDHLTVSGDVTFGKDIVLRGTVIVIANHGDRIDIPPGAILENKIISGNLRILDH